MEATSNRNDGDLEKHEYQTWRPVLMLIVTSMLCRY